MTDTSTPLVFVPLSSELRRGLERSVVEARDVVERGVGRVFDRLGIQHLGDPFSSGVPVGLSDDERVLRLVVGAKVRQAGGFDAAVEEVAFGVWHRMLFARFLAENGLLMHPEHNVGVTLDECDELAHSGWGADRWVVASQFAARMLPGLFPVDDPLGRLELLPEDLHALEGVLGGIPSEVFTSDDGLGWVYQFWQSRRKDEVNASEVKIGARELPAVTQLFTEHYMVRFLLENSLGAWWAARHPDSPLNESFEYLRFDDDGDPAAGSFEGWPDSVAEVTAMDPCCGSGHFLTSLFEMLWRMRVEEEGLDPVEAQDLVLSENLFGLELDPRCTQIAAFNVALTAWKAGGYRELPELNVACSGIRVAGSKDSWLELAGDDARLRDGLERLHDLFKDADTLGSLIDPKRAVGDESLLAAGWDEIQPLLTTALERETAQDPVAAVFGQQVTAVVKAANLLSRRCTLVATNPPFRGRSDLSEALTQFLDQFFSAGAQDIATGFILRSLQQAELVALVAPQNWITQVAFEDFRRLMLRQHAIALIARLGEGAFRSAAAAGAFVGLYIVQAGERRRDSAFALIDVAAERSPESKALGVKDAAAQRLGYQDQLRHPAARMFPQAPDSAPLLSTMADSRQGIKTGDDLRYRRRFWELAHIGTLWARFQSSVEVTAYWAGLEDVVLWEEGQSTMATSPQARIVGSSAWGRRGVTISQMRTLRASLFTGCLFDTNASPLVPRDPTILDALWCYVASPQYNDEVRRVDHSLKVTNSSLTAVPFDVEYWRGVAEREFPDGLPEPWSDDPTQWLFLGDPAVSTDPLQVGVARLVGYSWPDQEPGGLDRFLDDDGIVCLPSVMGETPAADRLRELLVEAFDGEDDPVGLIDGLLVAADAAGKGLGWWLENRFFKQHNQLFHKRPFIWHVTDGHRDGFSALVNYHQLDRSGLERLTFTYLGWWIDAQRAAVTGNVAGADDRLAAAEELQDKLKLILEGEPPFDIFVRWKLLAEQSIGWDPDLDDGVRLNIRPFVEAGVLKVKKPPGIKWGKDRGKNPDGSKRFNDLHFTRAEKQAARDEE